MYDVLMYCVLFCVVCCVLWCVLYVFSMYFVCACTSMFDLLIIYSVCTTQRLRRHWCVCNTDDGWQRRRSHHQVFCDCAPLLIKGSRARWASTRQWHSLGSNATATTQQNKRRYQFSSFINLAYLFMYVLCLFVYVRVLYLLCAMHLVIVFSNVCLVFIYCSVHSVSMWCRY